MQMDFYSIAGIDISVEHMRAAGGYRIGDTERYRVSNCEWVGGIRATAYMAGSAGGDGRSRALLLRRAIAASSIAIWR